MQKKHVFVDWFEIEAGYGKDYPGYKPPHASPYGVELKVNKPVMRTEPFIKPDKPWENWRVGSYGTYIKIDGKHYFWYEATLLTKKTMDLSYAEAMLCYAVSDDGINWEKPDLGVCEYEGSTKNNIVAKDKRDHGYCVFYDSKAKPEERFKMIFSRMERINDTQRRIMTIGAVSSDGIHWKQIKEALTGDGDTQQVLSYDNQRQKYVIYSKSQNPMLLHRRVINRCESSKFGGFSDSELILYNDPSDLPDWDYYNCGYNPWPGTDDAQIMLISMYYRTRDTIDVHLATSREGKVWNRPLGRDAFIPCGGSSTIFGGMIMSSIGIIDYGDGSWGIPVNCTVRRHMDTHDKDNLPEKCGYFAAKIREDGFMCISAYSKGEFNTIVLKPTGDNLKINAACDSCGYIKVGVLDADTSEFIEGFESENCLPVDENAVWQDVKWKSGNNLSDLNKDKKYRIKFSMFKADLFAYKF